MQAWLRPMPARARRGYARAADRARCGRTESARPGQIHRSAERRRDAEAGNRPTANRAAPADATRLKGAYPFLDDNARRYGAWPSIFPPLVNCFTDSLTRF